MQRHKICSEYQCSSLIRVTGDPAKWKYLGGGWIYGSGIQGSAQGQGNRYGVIMSMVVAGVMKEGENKETLCSDEIPTRRFGKAGDILTIYK